MKINLLNGNFTRRETLELITKMIHVKVKHHEEKLAASENETEMKLRETRIRQLQKELYEAQNYLETCKGTVKLKGEINL